MMRPTIWQTLPGSNYVVAPEDREGGLDKRHRKSRSSICGRGGLLRKRESSDTEHSHIEKAD